MSSPRGGKQRFAGSISESGKKRNTPVSPWGVFLIRDVSPPLRNFALNHPQLPEFTWVGTSPAELARANLIFNIQPYS
jgi:hypothetical protein